jgi:2'-hydroxyisoflavone reductase
MPDRREFLTTSAALGIGLSLGGCSPNDGSGGEGGRGSQGATPGAPTREIEPADRRLRILFLGGTGFLGPAQVEYALARGHTVTLFNRGRTNPGFFPGVEKLVGDRAVPDYSALEGREWDVVIDNSANVAAWVKDATEVLEGSVGRYLFVSSLSAHSGTAALGQDEDSPVFTHADYEAVVASGAGMGEAFGPNKAEGERITLDTFGDRGLVVRPTLIVGPGDRSDRFTYWPVRIDRGGEVVAPGDGTDLVQYVDVRDLGQFMVRLVETDASGTYNAVGPEAPIDMAGTLYGVRAVTAADVHINWVPAEVLREHEVGAWMEMPLWVYPGPETAGFSAFDGSKAIAAGLTLRPLADTARDTLEWWKGRPSEERTLRTGLSPEKEAAILADWRARRG